MQPIRASGHPGQHIPGGFAAERFARQEALDLIGGESAPEYSAFLHLCRKSLKPIPYHDIQGTCGRDDKCECRSCWVRRGGYNRPGIGHAH